MMFFFIFICDLIFFDVGIFVFIVDVNFIVWRGNVVEDIYWMIFKYYKDIVKKVLILVENICKRIIEDFKNLDRSFEKWKERIKCMDIIECKYGNKVKLWNFDKKLRWFRIFEFEFGDIFRKYYEYWFM